MPPTIHTQWADRVAKGDRRGALAVLSSFGLADNGATDFFLNDLRTAGEARRAMKQPDFSSLCRFDSADPVTSVAGWGVAENYFILAKNVSVMPFVGTPLLDNLKVVGPEEYPPMADRYIAQIAQTGLGTPGDITGYDADFPTFESVTTAFEFKTRLRGGKVVVSWAQKERQNLPGAVNLDKAATDLKGLQKVVGELDPEQSAHEGAPSKGVYGLVNHPGIMIVTPSALTYGTTNMREWGVTEAAIRDIANTIVSYLQSMADRASGIEGYMPDTVIVPNWLDILSGRMVYGLAVGGSTYPIQPMKQYILAQCPWIKSWIGDPWLNAVNNTTNRLAVGAQGVPDSSVLSSRLACIRNEKDAIHFAQPIGWQQFPPWMASATSFHTVGVHQDGGIVVKIQAPNSSLIC